MIVALDEGNAHSGKVNVIVIEDDDLPGQARENKRFWENHAAHPGGAQSRFSGAGKIGVFSPVIAVKLQLLEKIAKPGIIVRGVHMIPGCFLRYCMGHWYYRGQSMLSKWLRRNDGFSYGNLWPFPTSRQSKIWNRLKAESTRNHYASPYDGASDSGYSSINQDMFSTLPFTDIPPHFWSGHSARPADWRLVKQIILPNLTQ